MSELHKKRKGWPKVDRQGSPGDTSPVCTDVVATTSILSYILAHAKGDSRPYLTIRIYGIEMLGLLDSGCSTTVIGKYGWDVLKDRCKLQNSSLKSCTIANGSSCEILGSVTIPLHLREKVQLLEVIVVPSLPHYIILGVDFWLAMKIIPDLSSGEWCFRCDADLQAQVHAIEALDNLTPSQKEQLDSLIQYVFKDTGDKLGCTTMVEHVITTQSPPIKQRHYPLSPALQAHVNKELEKMLADDIIEPSNSPWASPIVLVRKPDNSYRFCVNYKKLNEVSLKDAYPIPFVSSTLDKLREAKYISTIDIKSAYWQIPVAKESRPLTAFVVPTRGLFQFKRMPFGLHNAPSTWQRFIDRVLGHDLEQYVSVYLDDIILTTATFSKHIEILQEVFRRLKEAGLTLNRDKCHFCKRELKFLGHIVTSSGLMVDPEKVEAVVQIPTPKTVSEVRRIVGLASWYRRFVPNFSSIVAPMTNLLRKHQPFVWTEECSKALTTIKNSLVSAPILACPDFSKHFYLQTDASDFGLGAVLTQMDDTAGEKVICYLSRSLTKVERRYSIVEKECLAAVFAIEKLRGYLEGTRFTLITDHFSLKWLFSIKDPIGRIARWAVRLQQYDFNIEHRSGRENVVADALSRTVPAIESITISNISPAQEDKWYSNMLSKVRDQPLDFPLWRVENDLLFKRAHQRYPSLNCGNEWLLVVPKHQRANIIGDSHNPPTSGHLGVHKTLNRISSKYYWPKQKSDVARYIRRCEVCLRTKPEQKAPVGHMLSLPSTSSRPWQMVSIDLVGPLPRSSSGYCYIFTLLDCFSKFILLLPLRAATASKITQLLEEQILLYGAPEKIICDNGVQFKSHLFQNKVDEYGISLAYTANYHPQSNPVERVHRVVKTMLSAYVADHHPSWDKYLAKVGWAIRSAVHDVTNLTPNFIFFGRELNIVGNSSDQPNSSGTNFDPLIRSEALKEVYNDVKGRLKKAYEARRHTYNLRRRDETFRVGQKVWRRNYVISDAAQKFTSKLASKFQGPFIVGKVVSPYTVELKDQSGKDCGIWHGKDLKSHPPDDD